MQYFTQTSGFICFFTLAAIKMNLVPSSIGKAILPMTFGVLVVGTTMAHVYWEDFKRKHQLSTSKSCAILCDVIIHWVPFLLLYCHVRNAPWSKFGFPVAMALPILQYKGDIRSVEKLYDGMPIQVLVPLYVLAVAYANAKL